MGRQITLYDLIHKLDYCLEHNNTMIRRMDLLKIFMLDDMHPWISSQNTFNEKIRVLSELGFLPKVNNNLFKVDWDLIDIKLKEWGPNNA